jgi:hypothetical protein
VKKENHGRVPAEWKLTKAIIESQEPTGLWHY